MIHKQKKNSQLESWNVKCLLQQDTVKRLKRQTTDWDNMFANYISRKGQIPKIYEKLKIQQQKTQMVQLGDRQKMWWDISPRRYTDGK